MHACASRFVEVPVDRVVYKETVVEIDREVCGVSACYFWPLLCIYISNKVAVDASKSLDPIRCTRIHATECARGYMQQNVHADTCNGMCTRIHATECARGYMQRNVHADTCKLYVWLVSQVVKEVPQPIEKVQYREVPVPVEVIVERVVEKIVIKEVPVEKVIAAAASSSFHDACSLEKVNFGIFAFDVKHFYFTFFGIVMISSNAAYLPSVLHLFVWCKLHARLVVLKFPISYEFTGACIHNRCPQMRQACVTRQSVPK